VGGVKIRPSASNTETPVGIIASGEIVEVYKERTKGAFYQLVDGRVI
jgi:hypothetical protein